MGKNFHVVTMASSYNVTPILCYRGYKAGLLLIGRSKVRS